MFFAVVLALLSAVSAAPVLSVFDKPWPVDRSTCAVLAAPPVDIFADNTDCCDACHHPYLLHREKWQLNMVAYDAATSSAVDYSLEVEKVVAPLSDDVSSGARSVVQTEIASAVSVATLSELKRDITFTCGRCLETAACYDLGGRIELWHHQCIV